MIAQSEIHKLKQKKFRQQSGYFLVEGEHLLLELEKAAEHNAALKKSRVFVSGEYTAWPCAFETTEISDRQMAKISDTANPQGIVAVVPMAALQRAEKNLQLPRAVYLCEIQDPGNLGTILRTLGWFGGFECLLGPGSVDPFNPKVVRASMGAIFHVPLHCDVSLQQVLESYEAPALIDLQGEPIVSATYPCHDCLIFGNEARGLPRDEAQLAQLPAYRIPGGGALESLNLATAVNLGVYELLR